VVFSDEESLSAGIQSASDYGLVWAGLSDPVHFNASGDVIREVVENADQFGAYWHILKSVTCSPFNPFIPLPLELLAC
jgi:hypothetical protein